MAFDFLISDLFGLVCPDYVTDNLVKIPISLEEKWQTISYGKFHWKHWKVHKKGSGRKNITLICVTRKVIPADLNLKQQFDSLPFRLVL